MGRGVYDVTLVNGEGVVTKSFAARDEDHAIEVASELYPEYQPVRCVEQP